MINLAAEVLPMKGTSTFIVLMVNRRETDQLVNFSSYYFLANKYFIKGTVSLQKMKTIVCSDVNSMSPVSRNLISKSCSAISSEEVSVNYLNEDVNNKIKVGEGFIENIESSIEKLNHLEQIVRATSTMFNKTNTPATEE